MRFTLKISLPLVAATLSGCSGGAPEQRTVPAAQAIESPRRQSVPIALSAPLPSPSASAPTSPKTAPGARHFRRSELNRMIQKGPGHLLRYVRVSPSHKARRFLGFRLDEVMTQDPRFQTPNVSAGDIILHINKVRIQTPGDFHKAFLTLKNSQKIVFDILRGERRFLVIYPVLNDVTLQPDGAQ